MGQRIYHSVNTFNAGEMSELIFNREDISKYRSGCRVLENAFPLVEGGAKKIPGTQYAGAVFSQGFPSRLAPFQFATNQGAFLEFGPNTIRIWRPNPPGSWNLQLAVDGGGNTIVLTTPYTASELFQLDCSTQSVDVLWIFHPNHPPAVVERFADNNWQYSLSPPGGSPGEFPYRGTTDVIKTGFSGIGAPIISISQANPAVVVSTLNPPEGERVYINLASGLVELNQGEFYVVQTGGSLTLTPTLNGAVFLASISGTVMTVTVMYNGGIQVGMAVVGAGVTAGTVVTSFGTGTGGVGTYNINNSQSVGGEVMSTPLVNTTGYLAYTGGGFIVPVVQLFNTTGNFPACGTFYQERLCVGGSNNEPTKIYGSVQDDFPDFITDPNADDFAIQFTLVSTKLDQILNMIGSPNALVIGTAGGIWIMSGANGASLSQTNVVAAKQTTMGVGPFQAQLIGDSAIFVSRSAKIVSFLSFDFVTNAWNTFDLTRLNRQITIGNGASASGITQTAFQTEPYPIFWAVRSDGQLLGLVMNRQDQVFAWFRVNFSSDPGFVESVAVISSMNNEDMIAITIRRTINGGTVRYVEFFMQQELFNQLSNAFFVRSGVQVVLSPGVNIQNITNANPPTVTALGHNFVNGETIQISGVLGMTQINQDKTEAYTVINTNTLLGTFQLQGMDTTGFAAYTGGGVALPVTNKVSGLIHLFPEAVTAVGDGALILPPTPVTGDTITLQFFCNNIVVGLPYQMTVQPTNPVQSNPQHTTRGTKQKCDTFTISLYQSMGGQYGQDLNHMYDITYGTGTMSQPPTMTTDEFTRNIDDDWDDETTLFITQNTPFPFTLRGLVMRMSYNVD